MTTRAGRGREGVATSCRLEAAVLPTPASKSGKGRRKPVMLAFMGLGPFAIYPHLLRHTMAHRFLESSGNDLVALAQILGHESLNTTSRYTRRTQIALAESAEKVGW